MEEFLVFCEKFGHKVLSAGRSSGIRTAHQELVSDPAFSLDERGAIIASASGDSKPTRRDVG
jgi:hypothetical protein